MVILGKVSASIVMQHTVMLLKRRAC